MFEIETVEKIRESMLSLYRDFTARASVGDISFRYVSISTGNRKIGRVMNVSLAPPAFVRERLPLLSFLL